jgi:hypothetical protein
MLHYRVILMQRYINLSIQGYTKKCIIKGRIYNTFEEQLVRILN